MTTVEKLQKFREKVLTTRQLDKNFKDLVGIEIFDFMHENEELNPELERRVNYLKNLSTDKNFIDIQDKLYETIVKILKLTDIGQIEELPEELKTGYIIDFKNIKNKSRFTLPELYNVLLVKENYWRLGDKKSFSPSEGDIASSLSTFFIRKQYDIIEQFLDTLFFEIFNKNNALALKHEQHANEYNVLEDQFDEKINKSVIKLHIREFNDFFSFCLAMYPRLNFGKRYYILLDNLSARNLEIIKNFTTVVIDDLIETMELQSEHGNTKSEALQNVIKKEALKGEIIKELQESGRSDNPTGSNFIFNPETGLGSNKKKEFRFGMDGDEYALFAATFKVRGKKVVKEDVNKILKISLVGGPDLAKVFSSLSDVKRRKTNEEVNTTNKINDVVKNIRSKTGLTPKEFVNNNGNITLTI